MIIAAWLVLRAGHGPMRLAPALGRMVAVLAGIALYGASIMLIAQMYHMDGNPPDAVLLWAPNCAEWVATFFGCALSGVIAVPVDDGASPDFARRIERSMVWRQV